MKFYTTALFLVLLNYKSTKAQVPSPGNCSQDIKVDENFNAIQYLGKWYEYSKYPFIFETGGKCIYAIYGTGENSTTVTVINSQINMLTNTRTNITGNAILIDGVKTGKLLVKFNGIPSLTESSNYWILGTDYKNFSVVYSCRNFLGSFHTTVIWILTRNREPPNDIIQKAYELLDANNLSKSFLLKTKQSNCPEDEH